MTLKHAAIVVADLATALALVVGVPSGSVRASPRAEHRPEVVGAYDLGVHRFAQPQGDRYASMPIRLWGAVAVPTGPGPFPLVVVVHGAHGDNCPAGTYDAATWPCFAREQRNDLGFTHLARALAERGMVAVVPDVNAAYTGGWGESAGMEYRRTRQVLDATVAAVRRSTNGEGRFAGVDLTGRVDLSRIGVLGHSRGGMNSIRWAAENPEVAALFLLAPARESRRTMPDVPLGVAVGTCDGDTGQVGLQYAAEAARDRTRTTPTLAMRIRGANHNYFNQRLAHRDDHPGVGGGCAPTQRASAPQQREWLDRMGPRFLAAMLNRVEDPPPIFAPGGPTTARIAGLQTQFLRHRGPAGDAR